MRKKVTPLLMIGLLASCRGEAPQTKTIVASFYPIYFVASQIAGEQYEVINLTPAGTEPHDFQLTPRGRAKLEDAQCVFVNGLGMEAWTSSIEGSLKEKTYTLSDGLAVLKIEGRDDPHVWLDTHNYGAMAKTVCDRLSSIDSSHADYYRENLNEFSEKLSILNEKCAGIAEKFDHKAIAVSHAAYGYMCEQYGIEQLYINGLSPDDKPQAQSLGQIIDAMNEKGIDTIFFEELVSPEIAEYIATQTGSKVDSLNPLESLTEESIEQGEDYFSVYEANMEKIGRTKP